MGLTQVHQRFSIALRQMSYNETRQMLRELDAWLRAKIESAADFLLEAFEELLTQHWLKVPVLLRKALMSTKVRHNSRNITRTRGSEMIQRWLGALLLYREGQLKKVKSYAGMAQVLAVVMVEQEELQPAPVKKAA